MTTFDQCIQLSFRPGIEAKSVLDELNKARFEGGTGELISGYYDGQNKKVYLSCPGCPIESNVAYPALSNKLKLEPDNNYFFYIRKSALAQFAKGVVDGGPPSENDLLEYDKAYLDELNKKTLSTLKTAIASAWAGDFVWAALSFPLALGEKVAENTPHFAAMIATNLAFTIAFPFLLGPLVGYVHYRAQIADYEAKYGVSPPPEMLRKINHQSKALAFQVSCSVGGWTLAYELAEPAFNLLLNFIGAGALASTPAYWLTVFAVGLFSAIFVVIACAIAQHYLQKNNTADKEIDYLRLGCCAFAAGSLFMLCFSVPGCTGLKGYLLEELGMQWSRIICGLTSSVLIGTSVTTALGYYSYEDNIKFLKKDRSSHMATIKGCLGMNSPPSQGPKLAY